MKQLCVLFTRFFIEIVTFGVLTIIFTKIAYGQVLINEVMPAPTEGSEWVELKNITDMEISLSGWKLEDAVGTLSPTPNLQTTILPAHGLAVFELNNKLNNTGDSVILKNSALEVIDTFSYSSSSATQSWSKNTGSQFVLTSPSKGAENIFPSPTPSPIPSHSPSTSPSPSPAPSPLPTPLPTPTASPLIPVSPAPVPSPLPAATLQPVQLSEIVACPESGESEWIEFYNPNSVSVELQGWKIKDNTGNSRTLNLSLAAKNFSIFELSTGMLNNDGDSLTFFNQDGRQLLSLTLPTCEQEQSTVFTTAGWKQTSTVTAYTANVFTSPGDTDRSPTPLELEAVTTNESDTFSSPYFPELANAEFETLSSDTNFQIPDLLNSLEKVDTNDESQIPVLLSSSPLPLTSPLETSDIPHVEQQPVEQTPFISKAVLTVLLFLSLTCLAVGGYGMYKWYTERRVEEALQLL